MCRLADVEIEHSLLLLADSVLSRLQLRVLTFAGVTSHSDFGHSHVPKSLWHRRGGRPELAKFVLDQSQQMLLGPLDIEYSVKTQAADVRHACAGANKPRVLGALHRAYININFVVRAHETAVWLSERICVCVFRFTLPAPFSVSFDERDDLLHCVLSAVIGADPPHDG